MQRKMTEIENCEASECLYNNDGSCRTFAVTIGKEEPCCDTYMHGSKKGGIKGIMGGIGACHTSACKFNKNYECSAKHVTIGMAAGHPDCATFKSA